MLKYDRQAGWIPLRTLRIRGLFLLFAQFLEIPDTITLIDFSWYRIFFETLFFPKEKRVCKACFFLYNSFLLFSILSQALGIFAGQKEEGQNGVVNKLNLCRRGEISRKLRWFFSDPVFLILSYPVYNHFIRRISSTLWRYYDTRVHANRLT